MADIFFFFLRIHSLDGLSTNYIIIPNYSKCFGHTRFNMITTFVLLCHGPAQTQVHALYTDFTKVLFAHKLRQVLLHCIYSHGGKKKVTTKNTQEVAAFTSQNPKKT